MPEDLKQRPKEEVFKAFEIADIVKVMHTYEGRRTIAAILELLMHEVSAMAKNAAELSANVARQEVAHTLKDWVWSGGGKQLWRNMEDEIEVRAESEERSDKAKTVRDPFDLEN